MRRFGPAALVAALLALMLPAAAGAVTGIRVDGDHLEDILDGEVQLVGVNRASFEYTCVQPTYTSRPSPTHTGPISGAAVDAMATWHVNVVRIPLNEQCWLGVNPVKRKANRIVRLHGAAARRAGKRMRTQYRKDVTAFVNRITSRGMIAILDLHWSAPGKNLATSQHRAPDKSHSIDFWRSVASRFKDNLNVMFDLFNEPLHVSWKCLRDGSCKLKSNCADCPRAGRPSSKYKVAGMQRLVNVIRNAGADQALMIPGPAYTHDLRKWRRFAPTDPLENTTRGSQLVASFHNYVSDQNHIGAEGFLCHLNCWNQVIAPLSEHVPVVTGEFGQFDCKHDYVRNYMNWADDRGISYLGWWWYVKSRFDGPGCQLGLIKNFLTGAPSAYGSTFRNHFLAVNP